MAEITTPKDETFVVTKKDLNLFGEMPCRVIGECSIDEAIVRKATKYFLENKKYLMEVMKNGCKIGICGVCYELDGILVVQIPPNASKYSRYFYNVALHNIGRETVVPVAFQRNSLLVEKEYEAFLHKVVETFNLMCEKYNIV